MGLKKDKMERKVKATVIIITITKQSCSQNENAILSSDPSLSSQSSNCLNHAYHASPEKKQNAGYD